MKAIRIVLFVLVVAGAGYFAFRAIRGDPPADAPPPPPPPAQEPPGGGTPAFPDTGPEKTAAGGNPESGNAAKPKAVLPTPDVGDPSPGTPAAAGASAAVVVPYRAGTKSRYRVNDGLKLQDLASDAVQWWEFEWFVTTEVVQGDGTGPARVRLTVDDFTFKTETPNFPVLFRAKEPIPALLENEELARTLRPQMAVLGMPVEFAIGAGGEVTGVEGAEGLNRKFLEAVDEVGAKYVKDAIDAPSAESLTQRWSEILFPPVGGGTLKSGDARDAKFHLTYYERWDCVTAGRLRLTHADPDAFRVEFKGKPEMEELHRSAKSPAALALRKVQLVSSADSYVAAWRFDTKAGRLVRGSLAAKYRVDVSRGVITDSNGQSYPDAHFTNVERRIVTQLLDD
jgi:hypothetical protein